MGKYTEEQRKALQTYFPSLTIEELNFIEKTDEFSDTRPQDISDEEWSKKVTYFLLTEGKHLNAWDAMGKALKAFEYLPKEIWRNSYPFGACLMTVLGLFERR